MLTGALPLLRWITSWIYRKWESIMVWFLLKFVEIRNSRQYQIPPIIIIYRDVGYCREIMFINKFFQFYFVFIILNAKLIIFRIISLVLLPASFGWIQAFVGRGIWAVGQTHGLWRFQSAGRNTRTSFLYSLDGEGIWIRWEIEHVWI